VLRLSLGLTPLTLTGRRDPSYSAFGVFSVPAPSTVDRFDAVDGSAFRLASSITLSDCGNDRSVGGWMGLNSSWPTVELRTADGAACT
jgi:hypothetical protein